jgi:glycosyltransferase involved in cell wall biosynthesis
VNVIFVTTDAEVLREGSPAHAALREQSEHVNRLAVVVLNTRHRFSMPRKVTEKLWVFPTNSMIEALSIYDALRIIRLELFFRNRLQADIVVANDPLSSSLVAILASRRYGKPLHIHVPINLFSQYYARSSPITFLKSLFARICIGYANTVSVTSPATRAALVRKDPVFADRVTCIPQYVNVSAVQDDRIGDDLHLKYTQFRAILLVVAPLVKEHNITLAIDVLAEISEYHQHIGLAIIGQGIGRIYLKRYATLKGVGDKVMFETPREDMTSYYKSAFALIVPSLFDEFENTLVDAASAGCVIISSKVGSAERLIEHKENGFLCDVHNPKEYVDAINTLLSNEKLRMTMRARITEAAKNYMAADKDDHMRTMLKSWQDAITMAKGY